MKQNPKSEKREYEIIMDFIVGDEEMISIRRNVMLNASLLALANDEALISPKHGKSEYEKVVSFLMMINTCLDEIEGGWDELEERAEHILKNAFLLDPKEPSSKAYTNDCRKVLNTFMLSVLRNDKIQQDFEDLIYLFEALNQLINDVESLYSDVHSKTELFA
jgi:hypothetical protein